MSEGNTFSEVSPMVYKAGESSQDGLRAAWDPLPVDHDRPFIRLLRLKKGKDELPDCSLSVVRLDSAPPFDALSYCWGTEDDNNPILCNGRRVLVKPNLFVALERLRKTEHTLVWIDALCIQQSNIAEKNHQVALMDRIYQGASKTIIWLGPCNDDEAQLSHYVDLLGKAYHRRHRIFPEGMPSMFAYHGSELTQRGLPPWKANHEPLLGSIHNLYSQDWFKRTWIIQEFALSQVAVFFYGDTFFTIKQLKDALQILPRLSGWRYYDALHTMQYFTSLSYSRELAQESERNEFTRKHNALEITWNHSLSACSDQRDKVYSMLGIFRVSNRESEQEEFDIVPDYTASLEETYTRFASELLRVTDSLDLLYALRPSDLAELPLLPSWVPDFRTTRSYQGLYFEGGGTAGRSACDDAPVYYEIRDHKLVLSGFVFDEIIAVSCFEPNIHRFIQNEADLLADNAAALAAVGRILKSRFETCPRTGKYVNGEQAYDAFVNMHFFWRDIHGDLYPAHASFEQARQIIRWSEAHPHEKPELDLIDMFGDPLNMNGAYHHWGLDISLKAARTKQGYYCWVPCGTKIGDSVMLCAGSTTPLVSRQIDGHASQIHRMLGGCYVQGIMEGEASDSDLVEAFVFK